MPTRRGPAPQPTERKRLLGNPGQRRLPTPIVALSPVLVGEVLDPDDDSPGANLIRSILASAASTWISEPDRLATLELLRDGWNERAVLTADIRANGYGGDRYTRPAVLRLRDVEKSLTIWLSLLGLTPSDRSRLGVAEVKARSRLEDLRGRRDKSRAG